MLLSIVMMVKNEEKHLDKTLSSLQSLMNDINSELIILDTGSTDNTVDIAKKYTDKVYFEQWNNNFSYMRNISISYAKGDWILILDADEQIIKYDKLINFFNSDLCNKYNCASIEFKNIYSENEEQYDISSILRLFRNSKDFMYSGSIHEQPNYKSPIYNDILTVKHYGYLFEDEELRQKKNNRNFKILKEEITKNPNYGYINYQLGKQYIISSNISDAFYYIEKAYRLYKKNGIVPLYIFSDLANIYIALNKFEKCENFCTKYIKNDNKNIDMYFYLARSQFLLGKYKECIKNYKRYLYLLDNYSITTQSNRIDCGLKTAYNMESVKLDIITSYFRLEMYENVLNSIKELRCSNISPIYYIIFYSMYKLNKVNEILDIYNNNNNSDNDKNNIINCIEYLIHNIRVEDRENLYKVFSNICGSYGKLNKIRLGEKFTLLDYNELLKSENNDMYGDIIYYGIKNGFAIDDILDGLNSIQIGSYIRYLIKYRKDCVFEIYKHIENYIINLDINKLNIYSYLCNLLVQYGGLTGYKYKKLFLTYISIRYDYIKSIYNKDLCDNELINLINDKDDKFVIEIYNSKKLINNEIEYIRFMKKLLIDNKKYKKGIELLIKEFEEKLNISKELKSLKSQYKILIENSIISNNTKNAISMINEYESIFKNEELYNFKSIIKIYENNIKEAEHLLKMAYINDQEDENVAFNIAYIKERKKDYKNAIKFYTKVFDLTSDPALKEETLTKIENIKLLIHEGEI